MASAAKEHEKVWSRAKPCRNCQLLSETLPCCYMQVFDLTSAAEELRDRGSKPSKNQTLQLAPLQAHRHATEGYALDWSPQAAGQLATGDCKRHLHVWSPTPAGGWEVSAPYKGHTQSVEDLQWSPTEPNVSCLPCRQKLPMSQSMPCPGFTFHGARALG